MSVKPRQNFLVYVIGLCETSTFFGLFEISEEY